MTVAGIGVRGMSSSRLRAVLKRYGQAGQLIGNPSPGTQHRGKTVLRQKPAPQAVHVLTSNLTPIQDDDLAEQIIITDALLLVSAKAVPPKPGNDLIIDHARWRVESAVPLTAGDRHIFQLQITMTGAVSP